MLHMQWKLFDVQAQLLQRELIRQNEHGCFEPLLLEEGKAALLDISGPFLLQRQHLLNYPLSKCVELFQVSLGWAA